MKLKIITYVLIFFSVNLFTKSSCSIKNTDHNLSTSVIIPCYYKHFEYLFDLISDYCQQTIMPDEIVISLSEYHLVDQNEIYKLINYNWPFRVILITTEKKLFAGENRNIAGENCSGDIIICQDADDKPHRQRIEIIKSIFIENKVDHLMHGYAKRSSDLDFYYHKNISFHQKRFRLTPGNIAIKKEVFNKIKWSNYPRGQDCKFNKDVKNAGFCCQKIYLPLLWYRKDLSSKQSKNLNN
jgi:hypothetical protein